MKRPFQYASTEDIKVSLAGDKATLKRELPLPFRRHKERRIKDFEAELRYRNNRSKSNDRA